MSKTIVIDSIMGSGKTTWAINYMNSHQDKNFVYVTPFLDEIQRMKSALNRKVYEPNNKNEAGSKLASVKTILQNHNCICTTHALFQRFDKECVELLQSKEFILILDEVLDVIEELPYNKTDVKFFESTKYISVDNDGLLHWDEEDDSGKPFSIRELQDLKQMIKCNQIIKMNEGLLWRFPPKVFQSFKDIYVLTYNFPASILYYYFQANKIDFTKKQIIKGKICDFTPADTSQYKDLINIYSGKMNTNIPDTNQFSFSKRYYERNSKIIKQIKNNIYNYFFNVTDSPSSNNMWTSFKFCQSKLAGKGYTRGFVPCTTRATNKFKDKIVLAFPLNIYMHPVIIQYLKKYGCEVNQDEYALNVLVQWIWRSGIREGKKISIYLPSSRMRMLLCHWLGYDDVIEI